MYRYTMTINGERVLGEASYDVINPALAQAFAKAPNCTSTELDSTVNAARDAFANWRETPFDKRRSCLQAMADKIAENSKELGTLLTLEQGKPINEAIAEVLGAAHWFSEVAKIDLPENVSEDSDIRFGMTRHEPLGVVAALVPWNFPILLSAFKLAPVLLAGNTVILKPAPTTPLATLRLGELLREILPAGVLNVICGDDCLGPWISSHRGIDKVSFTGSTQTGRRVMESAALSLKRVTLELGGIDAAIVLDDVNVEVIAKDIFCQSP